MRLTKPFGARNGGRSLERHVHVTHDAVSKVFEAVSGVLGIYLDVIRSMDHDLVVRVYMVVELRIC